MRRNKPQPCFPGGFLSNYQPTGDEEKKEISHEVECNEGGYERSHQKEYLKWDLQESERDSPATRAILALQHLFKLVSL